MLRTAEAFRTKEEREEVVEAEVEIVVVVVIVSDNKLKKIMTEKVGDKGV